MCKQLFRGQKSLRMTQPLGKTGSKPLWTRAWVWFVIVQMWEARTSSHRSPWSLREGAEMRLALPVCRKADTRWTMNSCKSWAECLPRRVRSAPVRPTFDYKTGCLKHAGRNPLSQTRHLPACDRYGPRGHSLSRVQLNPEQTPLSEGPCFT